MAVEIETYKKVNGKITQTYDGKELEFTDEMIAKKRKNLSDELAKLDAEAANPRMNTDSWAKHVESCQTELKNRIKAIDEVL